MPPFAHPHPPCCQVELARALDERAAWLADLRAAREVQQCETRRADGAQAARDAEAAELAGLRTESEDLRAQMAVLVGHQNHKQKIQYTMSLKKDNDTLKARRAETDRWIARQMNRWVRAGKGGARVVQRSTEAQ